MKKNIVFFILTIFFISLLSSCGSDEVTGEGYETNSYLTGTYSNYSAESTNKLILNSNGTELKNKEVSFYTSDNKTAKITFGNIIEGEAETIVDKIPLELNEEEGKLYFKGTYSSKKGNYDYSGFITMNLLSLSLSVK